MNHVKHICSIVALVLGSVLLAGCRGDTPSATQTPATGPSALAATPPTTATAEGTSSSVDGTAYQLRARDFADVIVYTQMSETGLDIRAVLLSADNPAMWNLTDTPGSALLPHWSPSLEYVAYLYFEPDAQDIEFWVVDVAQDGSVRPISSTGVVGVEDYAWSPDSQFLAYDAPRSDGTERDVYRMDVRSGEIADLTADSRSWDSDPAWSPDGASLAFVSDRAGDGVRELYNIWRMSADGGEVVNLTNSSWEDVRPAWSPDGRRIAFYRWSLSEPTEDGPAGLWIVSVDGSGERLVKELPGLVAASNDPPAWSPDGRFIAFQYGPSNDTDVYVVPVAGGGHIRVGEPMGHDFAVSWSPDSRYLLFCHAASDDLMLYIGTPEANSSEPLLGVGGNCYGEWAPVAPRIDSE